MHEVGRELVKGHVGAVLYVEGGEHLAVLGYDLGGELVVRMLEFFERRNLRKYAYKQQQEEHQGERGHEDDPVPLDYRLFNFICHFQCLKTQNYNKFGKTP